MNKYLNDSEYLFSILTALVKRNDGKIKITEEELKEVSRGDLIGLYFEPSTNAIVLKTIDPEKDLLHKPVSSDKVAEYEN